MKSHLELIERLQAEEKYLKALPEGTEDQKNAKLTAIAGDRETTRPAIAGDRTYWPGRDPSSGGREPSCRISPGVRPTCSCATGTS